MICHSRPTREYESQVEHGFIQAAKFLHTLHIYAFSTFPISRKSSPFAVILADIGDAWEHDSNRAKLIRWYWNGVFGELYGSAVETRIARDFMEVPAWLNGGAEPSTVSETLFRADRLKTMRMRLSAAYKGVNALLMKEGAQDFRSGQKFDHTSSSVRTSTSTTSFRKTGASARGSSPPVLRLHHQQDATVLPNESNNRRCRAFGLRFKVEKGNEKTPPILPDRLDAHLRSHLIDPGLLRADSFDAFMEDRQQRLLALIEQATGKAAYVGTAEEEGQDVEVDEDAAEAELTIAAP